MGRKAGRRPRLGSQPRRAISCREGSGPGRAGKADAGPIVCLGDGPDVIRCIHIVDSFAFRNNPRMRVMMDSDLIPRHWVEIREENEGDCIVLRSFSSPIPPARGRRERRPGPQARPDGPLGPRGGRGRVLEP